MRLINLLTYLLTYIICFYCSAIRTQHQA